ncbi:RICIN domain-containing protein [Kribbella sp.]|uniref:RICIN domain-containing protein n=1 Tax=Kribbella sp. TaxID=1871183 RepID=UPI002D24EB11|nr:RICIN domain-containing protein [Kribbella sp.]HZX08438.1 RICIN domain-containing protein [Kribbella sp.]
MRSRRSTGSSRFSDTFASRPGLPRITRLPDRRAWSTTAVVAALIGGIAIGATAITGGATGPTYTTDVAYAPQSRPIATPTVTPTASSTVTPTVTVTRPGEKVTGPATTTTVTGDPQQVVKTVIMPGVTVTLPPTTVTAKPPLAGKPTATVTTTTTATATTQTTKTVTAKPPAKTTAPRGVTTQRPPARAGAPVTLLSNGSNRCIDVPNASDGIGKDGTPLQVWDCNNGANQQWVFQPDGTIRSMGLCMDLAWASTADGTQVQLVNCNGGWAQKFALSNQNELVNPSAGKCVTADASGNGGRLTLRGCSGTVNQKWHKP